MHTKSLTCLLARCTKSGQERRSDLEEDLDDDDDDEGESLEGGGGRGGGAGVKEGG
jgi:hypothetical protein